MRDHAPLYCAIGSRFLRVFTGAPHARVLRQNGRLDDFPDADSMAYLLILHERLTGAAHTI